MIKFKLERVVYKNLIKPVLFGMDPEFVHDNTTRFGEALEDLGFIPKLLFLHQQPCLSKRVLGVEFPNSVGLAAGFDYDGHLAKVLSSVGFGFNTVGTVTAKFYEGNLGPRLARLPKSRSLLVNKGFKSEGAVVVAERLDQKRLTSQVVGISVGSSNLPSVNTVEKAIDDYLFTFGLFKRKSYIKYFELNISCPNTAMPEPFTNPKSFQELVRAMAGLKISQPIFVKMPNEITLDKSDRLVSLAMAAGMRGFIFSNLVKDRKNAGFDRREINRVKNLRGNFSGRPTAKNAKNLLVHTRKKFGKEVAIISVGGIFTPEDARERLDLGADLVQLITGMIFEGPQLAGEINEYLATH